jgi:acylphosphatase
MHRVTIRYEGRVQGVGFRATVYDLSLGFHVVGYVRNMTDGSVELQAEGEESDLNDFHQAILKRMSRNVISHRATWKEIDNSSFQDFQIAATSW